ncbi:Thermopsin [uncultured archaeon]|nr:Thermopsin [uncultured archaeon]
MRREINNGMKLQYKILLGIVIIFVILFSIGALVPPNRTQVNVNDVSIVTNSSLAQNVTLLGGFNAAGNSTASYQVNFTNPTNYNLTLESFGATTLNFSVYDVSPRLPLTIPPHGSRPLTLSIKVPNYNYTGSLVLVENYIINGYRHFDTSSYVAINVTDDRQVALLAITNASSSIEVLTPAQYIRFTQSEPYAQSFVKYFTNDTFVTLGNLSAGSYYVLMQSDASDYNFYYYLAPISAWKRVTVDGEIPLLLKNYSNATITVLSPSSTKLHIGSTTGNTSFLVNYTQSHWYLNRGNYSVRLNFSASEPTYIGINAVSILANPFYGIYGNETRHSLPVGIASYGLSGNLLSPDLAYEVRTDEVVGIANITDILAYDPSPPPGGVINQTGTKTSEQVQNLSKHGASLQLNAVMEVYQSNALHVYWIQDVLAFPNTSAKTFRIVDAIFDYGKNSTVLPGLIKGRANLTMTKSNNFYLNGYPNYDLNYSLPLAIKLIMRLQKAHGNETVSFGYQILKNDYCDRLPYYCRIWGIRQNATAGSAIFYDNVTFLDSQNASIVITPYYKTPDTHLYDTDLVFAGEGNNEVTTFNSLSATLGLQYENNGTLIGFPSHYAFGVTGESAYNLRASLDNGHAYVSAGELDPLSGITTNYSLSELIGKPYLP